MSLVDVISMLKQLVLSNILTPSLDHVSESLDAHNHVSGVEMVKDLVMVSSFICSSAIKTNSSNNNKTKSATGASRNSRLASLTPASAMVALAPYWAIVLLLSGSGQLFHPSAATTGSSRDRNVRMMKAGEIMDAFVILMTNPLTMKGSKDIGDEVLTRVNQLQTSMHKTMHATGFIKLFNRLKRFLKAAMFSTLHFMMLLGLSIHVDISAAAIHAIKSQLVPSSFAVGEVVAFEHDFVELVIIMVKIAPNQAMVTDRSNCESTPLAYAAAYRGMDFSHVVPELEHSEALALALCRALVQYCPSAMTIADKYGLFPLHLAARRGHSLTMSFMCTYFPYSCPLRDSTGKLALHHALLSHGHHHEATIIQLASVYPAALMDDGQNVANSAPQQSQRCGFNVMHYVQKNCPKTLYRAFDEILTLHQESVNSCDINNCNESCTTEASHSSSSVYSELSSGEDEHDDVLSCRSSSSGAEEKSGMDILSAVSQSMDIPMLNQKKSVKRKSGELDIGSTEASESSVKKMDKSVSEAEASILLQFADTLKMLYNNNSCANTH